MSQCPADCSGSLHQLPRQTIWHLLNDKGQCALVYATYHTKIANFFFKKIAHHNTTRVTKSVVTHRLQLRLYNWKNHCSFGTHEVYCTLSHRLPYILRPPEVALPTFQYKKVKDCSIREFQNDLVINYKYLH